MDHEAQLIATIEAVLGAPPHGLTLLGSSFAGQLYRVRSAAGDCALKWSTRPQPGVLRAAARGLALLAATHVIRVPAVQAVADPAEDDRAEGAPAFLLLEWLDGAGGGGRI